MKKILTRVTFFLIISLLLIVGSIWAIADKYEDDLKSFVISELQLNLTREIELGIKRMDYNVLSHFPNISVEIPDLLIHSFSETDDNFVKIKEINLVFDIFSLLNGDLFLNEIFLKDGEINIIYNEDDLPNYNIWKKTDNKNTNKSNINIEKIELVNVKISYQNYVKSQDYKFHIHNSNIIPFSILDGFVFNSIIEGDLLKIEQSSLLWKPAIPFNGKIGFKIINKDIYFNFNGDFFNRETNLKGSIQQIDKKSFWDINFDITNLGIAKTVSVLPSSLMIDELNKIAGNVDLKVEIRGFKTNIDEPSIQINYLLNSGIIKYNDFKITKLIGSGFYFQPQLSSIKKAYLKVEDFSFAFGTSKFSGDIMFKNFNDLWINTNLKADFDLKDIHDLFLKKQFKTFDGHVKFETKLEGNIKNILKQKSSRIKRFKSKGEAEFQNIEVLSFKYSQPLFFNSGKLKFNNKHLDIVSLAGKVNNSSFEMTGKVPDFIESVFSNHPITFESNLKIDKLKVEEFISTNGTSQTDSNYFFNLPKGLVLDVNLDLGNFSFRKFRAQNFNGAVLFKNQKLTFRDLNFESCGGTADISGKIDAKYSNKVVFECLTKLKHIDAKNAFTQLENFSQDVLLAKHVKGNISADIYLLLETDKNLNVVKDKIYTKTKLRISDGELNNFGPLVDLQQFMNNEFKMKFNLKHLKFETIENDIEIIKKTIFIPEMEIRTNDVNLDISGNHTFEQEIDYLFKVKHSQIFKAYKKNEIEQKYGIVENKDKTATLPLKMTGTVDNPKFSYDLKKKSEIIKKNIRDEIRSIGSALNKEFFGDKKKEEKKEKNDLNTPREKVKFNIGGIDEDEDEDEDEEYEEEF